ncbi:AraC family transcriptional regulator [Piscinibacter sp. HJYY11]|uniref:helix-turn-helix domain-containing protein n=1 Tax=Piscinibacter sp. HJYY11 TaxID=2801333 RepID=UPI00191D7307|nr:AraC family transcriptional regulator [Piscinibacter sp. HJYY11]MBL0730802.1 helix-turn-helix transcriptional regulator [Piscinibacter sp. HJYY11]
MLLTRRPTAPLVPYVETLWANERGAALPHAREFNLPTGRVDIVIPLLDGQCISRYQGSSDTVGEHHPGGVVHGAQDHATQRDTTGASSVVGVHFKPGGAAAFFGGALPSLRNRTVTLEALWGPSARALRDELQDTSGPHARLLRLEAYLMARLSLARPGDALVAQALHTMAQDPATASIEPLQRASGLGPTRFISRFERQVGLTPKRYLRVLRFHTLLSQIATAPPSDWALTAVQAGYADQSHLIHEFRRIAGMTPTAYAPLQPDQPTHMAAPGAR